MYLIGSTSEIYKAYVLGKVGTYVIGGWGGGDREGMKMTLDIV